MLAIADSYDQFRRLAGNNWKDYKYLNNASDIRGLENTILVLMGNWWNRLDLSEEEYHIREYCKIHNIKITQFEE